MCFQLPQATWWPASIVLASLPLSLCSLNSVTLKRLSFYSHTSSVSFLFTPRNWKLRVFSDYKGNLFSFRKLKAHTENQITCENHMTTENQLTPPPPDTHTHTHTKGGEYFLVVSPVVGGRGCQWIVNLLPSGKHIHSRLRAKISKPPLLLVLFLYVYFSTYSALLNLQATWHLYHCQAFSYIVDTSVHFEWH